MTRKTQTWDFLIVPRAEVQPGEGAIYRCCILMETSFAKSGLSWSGCVNS